MRLKSVTAADRAQALAEIRRGLGADAVIVATQDLREGGVRVTAAIEQEDLDLAALLAPPAASARPAWLQRLGDHHELPESLRERLRDQTAGLIDADPVTALGHALGRLFRFLPLPAPATGRWLLTGPPGAGKTASSAKIAARAVLEGWRPRVITTDAERAGGLEQLRALLAPLQLQPEVAGDVPTLRAALADEGDLVLIDSPGLNPFRSADLGRLSTLIGITRAEPLLVLPAGLGVTDSAEIAHSWGALGAKRMLVTKLDAARRLGGVMAAADSGVALADAGLGPTIGQGLRALSPIGLARLLLHDQNLGRQPAAAAGSAP